MREKSSEFVIHITSFGAISFLFYFIHFSPLAVHCREFEDFHVQTVNIVLILANQ